MAKVIDQKAYLKKYLTSDDKLQKKKKKKSKEKPEKPLKSTVKIIDDDAYTYQDNEIDESELYATNEEAPQIVGVIDERAADVIMKQEYVESGKWKAMKPDNPDSIKKHKKDKSPARKRRISQDESPPRRSRNEDLSPARKTRDSDESPPRRKRKDSDASPPRRSRQLSPQIRKRQGSDESPPRRKRRDSDASPPRRSRPQQSPPRRSRSPNNRKRSRSPHSYNKKSRWNDNIKKEKSLSPPPTHSKRITKTLDGKAAGLQNAQTLKRENEEYRARQDRAFREMKSDVSGRDAEVVIRDRRGRNKEFEFDAEKERKKLEAEQARHEEYKKWNKGLKQFEEIERKRAEYVHEASKPLARAADDEDLQTHLKEQERLDDPMLQYMRRKKNDDKRSKGVLEKPAYKGEFPDNRFNIRPGYRWDGVDRSNGYEQKYFNMINAKKSIQEEAYKYSAEDL